MDCTCKLPGMGATVMGRNGFPYLMKGQAGTDRKTMKPTAVSRGKGYGGHHHGGYYGGGGVSTGRPSLLSAIIPLALVAVIAGLAALASSTLLQQLFPTMVAIIGRSLPVDEVAETEDYQARLLAKLNDRQLFGNLGNLGNTGGLGGFGGFGNFGNLGNLGNVPAPAPAPAPVPAPVSPLLGLLGGNSGGSLDLASVLGAAGGSSGSNDVINQIAMQIAQQQIDNFINNGGAEAALTDLAESGKLEELVSSMVEKAMENVDPEEIWANMESNFEESLAGANGGLEEVMGGADFEELLGGVKLEELMGGMNMT